MIKRPRLCYCRSCGASLLGCCACSVVNKLKMRASKLTRQRACAWLSVYTLRCFEVIVYHVNEYDVGFVSIDACFCDEYSISLLHC